VQKVTVYPEKQIIYIPIQETYLQTVKLHIKTLLKRYIGVHEPGPHLYSLPHFTANLSFIKSDRLSQQGCEN
jgi:hypothetical protein